MAAWLELYGVRSGRVQSCLQSWRIHVAAQTAAELCWHVRLATGRPCARFEQLGEGRSHPHAGPTEPGAAPLLQNLNGASGRAVRHSRSRPLESAYAMGTCLQACCTPRCVHACKSAHTHARRLAAGQCTLVEWVVPPEIDAAGLPQI